MASPRLIVFRTDASREIGTGHVRRCLTLAAVLTRGGAAVSFLCRALSGHLGGLIRSQGFPLHLLAAPTQPTDAGNGTAHARWLCVDWRTDAEQSLGALAGQPRADWLVVDHYALHGGWEEALSPAAGRILVIDDLADRDHACDLLLDYNLWPEAETHYRSHLPARTRLLLGLRYALLRPEFAEQRARLRERSGRIERVLISFGGIDDANHTTAALEALRASPLREVKLDVVIGSGHPAAAAVRAAAARLPDALVSVDAPDMSQRIALADLAIGAAGVTTWERACLGLPAIMLAAADNQRQQVAALTEAGAALALAADGAWPRELTALLAALAARPDWLREMERANLALLDGRGAERVARELMVPEIALRRAQRSDSADLHGWRNSEDVRRHSRNPAPIAREAHERWLADVLTRPDRVLLIAEAGNEPVGVLRYDLAGERAEVSIYLVPGNRGRGLGPALLRAGEYWLAKERPELRWIDAEVLPVNEASSRAFALAGYTAHSEWLSKEIAHDQ